MTKKPQNLTDNTLPHSLGGAVDRDDIVVTGASDIASRRPDYWPEQKKFAESGDQTSMSSFVPIPTLKRVIEIDLRYHHSILLLYFFG